MESIRPVFFPGSFLWGIKRINTNLESRYGDFFNDLLQNHSVALFGWAIFHDPGQSRNTICPVYSYQNQWYNRSLKLTTPEREVVGSSLQSSLQFCQKIKKKKKMERGMGDFLLSPSKAKATWQNQTESGVEGS